jgi:hypothetical protein
VVPLIGYVDRFSARPGERIAVKVSSRLAEPYRADLVRITHGDANPAGPGLKFKEVERPRLPEPIRRGFTGALRVIRDCHAGQGDPLARPVHDCRAGAAVAA